MKQLFYYLCLLMMLVPFSLQAAPEIARIVGGRENGTLLIFGEGFREGTTEVYTGLADTAWSPNLPVEPGEEKGEIGNRRFTPEPLPAMLPKDAKKCRILQMDAQVIAIVPAGGVALWVKVGKELSKPFPINLPGIWWVSADAVAPGQSFRVFGTALCSNPYQPVSYAMLAPRNEGDPVLLPVSGGRHPFYERTVRVPEKVAAGDYQLYLHNGAGGPYGWSTPVAMTISRLQTAKPDTVINIRDLGAKGDGIADDTAPLQQALADAQKAGGAIVYLPPGTYLVHTSFTPGENVRVQGAGQSLTTLAVTERYGFQGTHQRAGKDGGLFILAHRCGLSDLTIQADPLLVHAVWIRRDPFTQAGEDIVIRHCTFRGGGGDLISIDGSVRRLSITDCLFDGTPGGIAGWGGVYRGTFSRNTFRCKPLWAADMFSLRHLTECTIEDNVIEYAHRGIVFQDWRGWGNFRHNLIAGNVVREITARRDNAGETYLLEGGSALWRGKVKSATPTTITVEPANALPTPDGKEGIDERWKPATFAGRIALIIAGRGFGQYRFIKSADEGGLTLSEPWAVVPDAGSTLVIEEAFVENLFLDNADLNGDAAVQFWGSCIGNITVGHISRNCQGLWLWTTDDAKGYQPCAFNEFINCRFLDRGVVRLSADRAKSDQSPASGPSCFGNYFALNQIADFRERPGNQYWPYWKQKDYAPQSFAAFALSDRAPVDAPGPGVAYNLFDSNQVLRGPVAYSLSKGTAFNLFFQHRVDGVAIPLADDGKGATIVEPLGQQ